MEIKRLAGGIIRNIDGDILLLHRGTTELSHWELPGGKIESEETPEDAAKREVGEELGVSVVKMRYAGSTIFQHGGVLYQSYWYGMEVDGQPQIQEPHLHDELAYFSVPRLRREERGDALAPNVQKLLHKIVNEQVSLET